MATKIDFKKSFDDYRARAGRFDVVDLPDRSYFMIDGQGNPNTSSEFTDAIETLYPLAYKLKFASKGELGRDYVVPPLEGLWWADDMAAFTTERDQTQWKWTLMILIPDWIEAALIDSVTAALAAADPPSRLDDVRAEPLSEGRCVQTLHIGPFSDEGPVLERMHQEIIPQHGFMLTGTHHEIYLSDVRRSRPERLRTILRQPVRPRDPEP